MPTIFTDDFNSYNDGNLNGQGDWAGHINFDVQGIVVKEGAKAIKCAAAGDFTISKVGVARTNGKKTFYFYPQNHSNWGAGRFLEFRLDESGDSSKTIWIRIYQTGAVGLLSAASLGDFTDDIWNYVEIEWRSNPDYKYRARLNGGAWSDWEVGYLGNEWTVGLNRLRLDHWIATTDAIYWDYIAEEPYMPSTPNFTDKKNYNGYNAFIQQYIRHRINGTTPWKNPDGTLL